MMALSKVSHVFVTAAAIQQWRKHYWSVARSGTKYDEAAVGICFGEHYAHLLAINAMHFDERARSASFCLGWQAGQLLATAEERTHERPGLWYIRPPGDRWNLEPRAIDLQRFERDVKELPLRSEDRRSREGLVLLTNSVQTSKSPVTARAFIFSLDRLTCREVAVQTDPIEDSW